MSTGGRTGRDFADHSPQFCRGWVFYESRLSCCSGDCPFKVLSRTDPSLWHQGPLFSHSFTSPLTHLTRSGLSHHPAPTCTPAALEASSSRREAAVVTGTPVWTRLLASKSVAARQTVTSAEAVVPLGTWVWLPPCMIQAAPSWRGSPKADARPCFRQSSECPLLHGAFLALPWGAPTPWFSGAQGALWLLRPHYWD